MIRMTPVQKTKLDLLGAAHEGGVSALVRSWIDAHPAPAPPAVITTRSKPTATGYRSAAGEDLEGHEPPPLGRFVELDPNA